MSTGIGAEERAANTPQTWASTQEAVASPDGKYLAIRTHSYLDPEGSENIGDQRVGITVLDTETGKVVRTVAVWFWGRPSPMIRWQSRPPRTTTPRAPGSSLFSR